MRHYRDGVKVKKEEIMTDDLMSDSVNDSGVDQLDSANAEKMLPQSQANDIIRARTKAATEKGHQAGYQKALADMQGNQSVGMQQTNQQQMNPDHIRQILAEEKHRQDSIDLANSFLAKLDAGADYPDYKETIAQIKDSLPNMPDIVKLAHSSEHTADIMYDLTKNKQKIAQLRSLYSIDPRLAQAEMQTLVNSIKANKAAANIPAASDPLSQIKSSALGADNGTRSIRDWKNDPRYRG